MTTRAAQLTVTANDQSRLFGQAEPAADLHDQRLRRRRDLRGRLRHRRVHDDRDAVEPGWDLPDHLHRGHAQRAGIHLRDLRPRHAHGELLASVPDRVHAGPLNVSAGEAVCIGAGGSQTGPVTVKPGGSLDVEGGQVTGPLTASGAAVVRICGATITGPLTISGSTGPVLVGGAGCDPNTIVGPVRVTDNTGGVEVSGNHVIGPLRVTGNSAPVHAVGNTVTGPVTIQP